MQILQKYEDMKEWIYYFVDVQNGIKRKLKYDVPEWKDFGITYGRGEKHTFVKSYSYGFTFVKEDAKWLKDILYSRGFNVRIKLEIYALSFDMRELLEYEGYLDLTDPTIRGNTFNCPIWVGGFFNALDNNWDKNFEVKASDMNSEFADEQDNPDFVNVEFTGGQYKYEEFLGLLDKKQVKGNMILSISNTGRHFLPIRKINDKDAKLNFFNNASFLNYSGSNGLTKDQCFIVSPDKLNTGELFLDFRYDFADLEFTAIRTRTAAIAPAPTITLINPKTGRYGNATVETTIEYFIFNDIGLSNWYTSGSGNRIYNGSLFSSKDIQMNATQIISSSIAKMSVNSLNMGKSLSIDLSKHINPLTDKSNGYMVALSISVNIFIDYFFADGSVYKNYNIRHDLNPSNTRDPELKLIPYEGTFVTYSNDKFMLNSGRTVHGITAGKLFKSLIDKFNAIWKVQKSIPAVKIGKSEVYKTNIDTSQLDYLPLIIASGTTLLGSKNDIFNSSIKSSVITSLKDFCEAMYKAFGLKLYCRYEKSNDTYYLTFLKIENCYLNQQTYEIQNVSELEITSDRENLYTSIKVGYNNSTDAIFGLLEYNTTNIYETSNTERETNELDLVCGYKGGALDLETYMHEKYHNYEDTQEGSSDIWLLHAYSVHKFVNNVDLGIVYENIRTRSVSSGGKINDAINTFFTPKRMLRRHEAELSSYLYVNKELKFLSSERNANFTSRVGVIVYVNNIGNTIYSEETEDINFTLDNSNYAKPFILTVTTPAINKVIKALDNNPLGYFKFKMNGKNYKGYLANTAECVQVNPMNETSSTFKLIAHRDSDL